VPSRSTQSIIRLSGISIAFLLIAAARLPAAESAKPAKPIRQITPGKVIIPFEKMRRIWGELVSVDLETRTGTFRAESEDKIYRFSVMPYAEMLHHATKGQLRDFKIGERAIFRLHVNEADEWYWLTYIQDEMNMLNGHKEYYFVETIDATTGRIGFTWAKGDKSFIREKGLFLETDAETQYWKDGKPAKFSDIKVGDKLRTKSHGNGKGRSRIAWHVFLDDASLLKFRDEQIAVHTAHLAKDGAPGYVDRVEGTEMDLTMFQNGLSLVEKLKPGTKVIVSPAGKNLKATGTGIPGQIVKIATRGNVRPLTLRLDRTAEGFEVPGVVRLRLER